jgi:hypothetical protein
MAQPMGSALVKVLLRIGFRALFRVELLAA